jgi:hypothetical protein
MSLLFYQKFGGVIKSDLVELFDDFHREDIDTYRLKFVLITVIPKEKDATTMNKFRRISLHNCTYKIFTKVLTNRIGEVVDRSIDCNQTTFIRGKYILESVITAHEVLHSVYHVKQQWFVLKLDYEKAYDNVNGQFLLQILQKGVL